jgi:hypothetical protein
MNKQDVLNLKSERDKLDLLAFDLLTGKFPFSKPVTVWASELDSSYTRDAHKMRVRINNRVEPLILCEFMGGNKVCSFSVYSQAEVDRASNDQMISWQMIRYALWKIQSAKSWDEGYCPTGYQQAA